MNEFKLSDIFDLRQGFAFKSKDFLSEGIPVLKIKNVKSSELSLHKLDYVDEVFLDTHSKYIPNHGDALISMSGNRLNGNKETWVGKVALFKRDEPFLVNQRVGILKNKNPHQTNTAFLVYALSSDYWQLRFAQTATSSGGQANLSSSQILSESIFLPPVNDQQAIANILSALDEKIELNKNLNKTLEEIAKAIFKSWFVNFDPVRAKAEGRPTGLPTEISDLFPDKLVDSEIGDTPKGWDATPFTKTFEFFSGGTPKTSVEDYWDGNVPWFSIADLNASSPWVTETEKSITELGLSKCSAKMIASGTTIVTARGTVGKVALAGQQMAINQSCYAMAPTTGYPNTWLYLQTLALVEQLRANAHGSVFDTITRKTFDHFLVLSASPEILNIFGKITSPIFERMKIADLESKTLSELRDTLLPKLISGELRIPDAEKFLEGASI